MCGACYVLGVRLLVKLLALLFVVLVQFLPFTKTVLLRNICKVATMIKYKETTKKNARFKH